MATSPPLAPIRLIAIDIDGTLLNSDGQIPRANHLAIDKAIQHGVEVVLATGRTFHHARPIAQRLDQPLILMVSNGALVKTHDGNTLATRSIPRHLATELIAGTRPVREGAAAIFDRSDATQYVWECIDWSHPHRAWYYERNRIYMTEAQNLVETVATSSDEPVQIAFTGSVEEMRTLAEHVRALPLAQDLTLTLTEYEARNFSLFDVTASGCSKGTTLAEWTRQRGLRPVNVMAIGDNLNDRDMLSFAGYPMVMGNAVPALKQHGWPETTGHDEQGVALAIERLVLNRAR